MMKRYNEINYLEIFKRSWKVAWNNRYLWWFGFFLALSGSGGGNYYFNTGSWKKSGSLSDQKISDIIVQNMHWVAIAIIAILVIAAIFIVIGVISRGALIDSVGKQLQGKTSDFKSGWREGRKNFWKIFLIRLVLGLFSFLAFVILSLPVVLLFLNKNYLIGILMAVLAFLIIIPLLVLAAYIRLYGNIYAILGPLGFWEAIEKGSALFQKNMASSLVMGLLFIPLGIIMGIASLMLILPVAIPFLISGFILYALFSEIGIYIAAIPGAICLLLIFLAIRAFWEVFAQSAWIIFFSEIAKPAAAETIAEIEKEPDSIPKAMPAIESEKN